MTKITLETVDGDYVTSAEVAEEPPALIIGTKAFVDDAIVHLNAAIKALTLEAYGGPELNEPLEHITIAEDLDRIDCAIGSKGESIFARLGDCIREAYVEILAAKTASAAARNDALEAKVAESHEPVAWMVREPDGSLHWSEMCVFEDEGSAKAHAENPEGVDMTDGFTVVPLYTHPPQADTDEIERLRSQLYHATVAVDSIREHTLEEAAEVAEGEVYAERYRTWPFWPVQKDGTRGNRDRESDLARHCDRIAAALRALKEKASD